MTAYTSWTSLLTLAAFNILGSSDPTFCFSSSSMSTSTTGLSASFGPHQNQLQHRKFEGPAVIARGGGGKGDENRDQKKSSQRFRFFRRNFHHPLRVLR